MGRLSILALLLYLGVDFAAPHMPGAFCFDADQSVDAVRAPEHASAPAAVLAARSAVPWSATTAARPAEVRRAATPPIAPRVTWSLRPRSLLSASTAPSPEAH